MYHANDMQPQIPTFSQETIEAINKAVEGKLEGLWETELAITQAILADSGLNPSTKAVEVQRAFARYLAAASGYSNATQISPMYSPWTMNPYGINYPGQFGRENMPGYDGNPLIGNPTDTKTPHQHGFELKADKEGLSATKVNLVFNLNKKGAYANSGDSIDVYLNGELSPGMSVHGVFDDYSDRNAVAIVVIAEPNTYFGDEEFKIGTFLGLMGALGLDSNMFGFTVRKMSHPGINTHETEVLYIDLANGDDPMEAENFSDAIKGNFATFVEYKNLFPASQ